MPLFGIDVHPQYQAGLDFDLVKERGYKFCFVKASQGAAYRPSNFGPYFESAEDAGLVMGLYHFLDESSFPNAQADNFLRAVDAVGGPAGKMLAVDFEAYGALSPSNATLESFVSHLRARLGGHPLILYSGKGFWEGGEPSGDFSRYGCDVAWDAYYLTMRRQERPKDHYQGVKEHGWGKRWGGVEPVFWQFTSTGLVAGRYLDVNAYRGTGERLLSLARDGGSRVRDHRPAGSTRNWDEGTFRVVREIEARFPVKCSTYPNHGRTGERKSIDVWVAPFRQRANREQEKLGDRIQGYVEANWNRFGLDYLIWWNWMKEGADTPWFSYEPYAFKWPHGDPDPDTRRHFDHLHISRRA